MTGIDLNSLLKAGLAAPVTPQAQPASLPNPVNPVSQQAPVKSPRPVARPDAVRTAALGSATQQELPNDKKWKEFLADPRIKSGLLQLGVNLLAGQGAGEALGGAAAAVGRAGDAQKAQEAEAAKLAAAAQRGRGGSGSATAKTTDKAVGKWQKLIDEALAPVPADVLTGATGKAGFTPFNRLRLAQIAATLDLKGVDPTGMLNTIAAGSTNADGTPATEDQLMQAANTYLAQFE